MITILLCNFIVFTIVHCYSFFFFFFFFFFSGRKFDIYTLNRLLVFKMYGYVTQYYFKLNDTGWGRKDGRFRNGYNSAKVVVTYIRPVPCNPLQLSIFLLVTHPSICCALPIVFSF